MYNENQKEEYLQYKKTEYLIKLFEDSDTYEAELEKDLCLMDTSELLHYLIKFEGYRNIEEKRRQLSNYVEWCVIKGYAPMNWISTKVLPNQKLREISVDNKKEFYISPGDYEKMRKQLEQSGYGIYIASFFSAIYEGIAGSNYYNLAKLRLKDIDKSRGLIHLADGTEMKVTEMLKDMLIETAGITAITNERTVQYCSTLYPDSIWKIRRNKEVTASKVQRKFVFLLEEIKRILDEEKITKKAIENSGYFNKIYYKAKKDGIEIKEISFNRKKEGKIENKTYDNYFEGEGWDMNMRKFINSFQSYLNQTESD